ASARRDGPREPVPSSPAERRPGVRRPCPRTARTSRAPLPFAIRPLRIAPHSSRHMFRPLSTAHDRGRLAAPSRRNGLSRLSSCDRALLRVGLVPRVGLRDGGRVGLVRGLARSLILRVRAFHGSAPLRRGEMPRGGDPLLVHLACGGQAPGQLRLRRAERRGTAGGGRLDAVLLTTVLIVGRRPPLGGRYPRRP